jgi:hypothetical protein
MKCLVKEEREVKRKLIDHGYFQSQFSVPFYKEVGRDPLVILRPFPPSLKIIMNLELEHLKIKTRLIDEKFPSRFPHFDLR